MDNVYDELVNYEVQTKKDIKNLINKYGIETFYSIKEYNKDTINSLLMSGLNDDVNFTYFINLYKFDVDLMFNIHYNYEIYNLLDKVNKKFYKSTLNKTLNQLFHMCDHNKHIKFIYLCLYTELINLEAKINLENRNFFYSIKNLNIKKLIDLSKELDINYGYVTSDIKQIPYIILFDAPFGQISWHTEDLCDKKYNDEWDGQRYSTFDKIEKYLIEKY